MAGSTLPALRSTGVPDDPEAVFAGLADGAAAA